MSRFLAYYENFVSKQTDAPREFGHAAGLSLLSTIALGRRWLANGIHPNVYMLLVGPSSRDRKSTSINLAMRLLQDVDQKRLGPSDFTPEGLLYYMSTKDTGKPKNKLIIPLSEFGNLLAISRREYGAGLGAMFCKLYDGETDKRVRSGKSPIIVKDPRLSMIGGCSYGMLEKYVDPVDWDGGFFARILFIRGRTRQQIYDSVPVVPAGLKDEARIALSAVLSDLIQNPMKEGVQILPEAQDLFRDFVRTIPDYEDNPAKVGQRDRLVTSIQKLSLLYQLDIDPQMHIGALAMSYAIQFASFAWESFTLTYARSGGHPRSRTMKKIWKFLDEAGEPVPRRDLYRLCNLGLHEFNPIIELMIQTGLVQQVMMNTNAHRGPQATLGYKCIEKYQD